MATMTDKVQSSPVVHTLKEVMAQNQCPLTKEYLRRSNQIAIRINNDYKTWSEIFNSMSSDQGLGFDQGLGLVMGGVVTAFIAMIANTSFSTLFSTLFNGALAAIPSSISGGYDIVRSNFPKTAAKELENKLPLIKKEMEQAGLNEGDKDRITSLFNREIRLLQTLAHYDEVQGNSKLGIALSSAVWMIGKSTGFPLLPTLGVVGGIGCALTTAMRFGMNIGLNPQEEANHIKSEIKHLNIL